MEFYQNSKPKMFCNMCLRKNPAKYACNKCNKFLCIECKSAHETMMCFQAHHLESLDFSEILQNGIVNHLVPVVNGGVSSNLNGELLKMSPIKGFNGALKNGDNTAMLPIENGATSSLCNEIVKILSNTDFFPNDIDNNNNSPRNPSPVVSVCSGSSVQPIIPDPDANYNTIISDTNQRNSNTQQQVHRMQVYRTFGQRGNGKGQFNSPHGLCVGFDEDIVIADSLNHRIQIFDKNGNYKFEFGRMGRIDGYLWHPRKIAILPKSHKYVVCDRGYNRSRMQIFDDQGMYCQKLYISYIEIVAGLTITDDEFIVLVDSASPTIFILNLKESLRTIDCRDHIREPSDIVANNKLLYICDFKGHSIVVVDFDGNFLQKFGRDNITNYPNGIDFSNGYIFIGDSHGNYFHVTIFKETGEFITEMRCPFVKASRCSGLQVTSNGRIITVDKNYHHVIIIDTVRLE